MMTRRERIGTCHRVTARHVTPQSEHACIPQSGAMGFSEAMVRADGKEEEEAAPEDGDAQEECWRR